MVTATNTKSKKEYGNLADPAFVARATGSKVKDVQIFLPSILSALREKNIYDHATVVAAIATAAVESMRFTTLEEAGYLPRNSQLAYLAKKRYADPDPVTGQRYYGRGIIQLTHKSNYEKYGNKMGVDLVHHPDQAKDPHVVSQVLADYFVDHGIQSLANASNWKGVRRKVNGGLNNYSDFIHFVDSLEPASLPYLPSARAKKAWKDSENLIKTASILESQGHFEAAHELMNDQIWKINEPNGLIAQLRKENPNGNINAIKYLERFVNRYSEGELPGSRKKPISAKSQINLPSVGGKVSINNPMGMESQDGSW